MDVQALEAPRRSGLRVHLTTRGPPGARVRPGRCETDINGCVI
jgi:hypothetical protein